MALHKRTSKLSIGLLWLVGSLLFGASQAHAQQTTTNILKYYRISELGLGIGGVNYTGDVATHYKFSNNRLGGSLFYRKVISQPISLRLGFTMGRFYAADEDYKQNPFQVYRDAKLKTTLAELSLHLEYYFLDHYDLNRLSRFTPYFFTGPGFTYYSADRDSGPENSGEDRSVNRGLRMAICMGAGIKVGLSRNWNLGLEFGPRLVLQKDYLDDLTAITPEGRQLSNPHDRDWFIYNGIYLSYTFYKSFCPRPYRNNTGILY